MPHALLPVVFFGIAFVFSMLGMGGSQIFIPLLYWAGLDFKTEAIPLGLLLNIVNSTTALVTYARRRLVDWRVGMLFGVAMLAAAPVGAHVNTTVPTRLLILMFAGLTAASAIMVGAGWRPARVPGRQGRILLGLGGGSALGLVAGLLGRGGGSFVVPLLFMAGLDPRVAAATSTVAITCSAASSLVAHLGLSARPDWILWGGCALAVYLGSLLGSHVMAARLDPRAVRRVFATVLLMVAILLVVMDR